jgi:uncharacterized membrane protein
MLRIEFRDSPNGRGTIVSATIAYDPPGGGLGKLVAKIARKDPNTQARHDLRAPVVVCVSWLIKTRLARQ